MSRAGSSGLVIAAGRGVGDLSGGPANECQSPDLASFIESQMLNRDRFQQQMGAEN
jgi:hypothetical protein